MNLEDEANKTRINVIKEIGFFGYKILITPNSGAFVVLLTFLGNIDENRAFSLDVKSL